MSDWASIWDIVPPYAFQEKLGSRSARMMASRSRLVCSGWAAALHIPTLRVHSEPPKRAPRYSRILDGAKSLSWVRPPKCMSGMSCLKNLRSLTLNYLRLIFDPEDHESSLDLSDILLSDDTCPARLERLTVTYCLLKTDELRHIGRLRALEHLNLSDANLDDSALAFLSPLSSLRSLDVSGNRRVTDAGLASLPASLTDLNISLCRVTDAGLALLRPSLAALRLNNCQLVTDAGLGHLARVATLGINYCMGVTGSGLAALVAVRSLRVSRTGYGAARGFSDPEFAPGGLATLSRLEYLDLSGCVLSEPLSIPTLTSLDMRGGSGLPNMRLPALARLRVYGSIDSVAELRPFGRTLAHLQVDASRSLVREGLGALGDTLPALATLKLVFAFDQSEDLELAPIKTHFPALTSLDVSGLAVEDADLVHMSHLSSLDLSFCSSVTGAGLAHLTRLSSVRLLNCHGIADKMAIEALWKTVPHVEF